MTDDRRGTPLLAKKGAAAPSFDEPRPVVRPEPAADPTEIRLPAPPAPKAIEAPASRPRVVVVAADTLGRKLLRALVAAHGCEVAMLGPADSPFSHVERGRPDLVVVDLDVGSLAARDLAFRIKADFRLQTTRVVAVTDPAKPAIGYDAFLEKPLSASAVARTLGKLAARPSASG
jgi:CheY-like chemotaxis protein